MSERDARGAGVRRHADRAAQFMPFAALTGYYDLIRERERDALLGRVAGAGGPPPPVDADEPRSCRGGDADAGAY
ncbi:hypothetical protein [Thermophilibacter sp.]